MFPKPTIVFIHGSWHNPSTWDKVAPPLEAQGYKCVLVSLPSGSPTTTASTTFLDDLTAARNAIISETTQGRDVVVVVHSYGGIVGASAIKDLAKPKEITPENKSGHVIGLALIATGFAATGMSFLDPMGGTPPPFFTLDPSGFAVLAVDPREFFYHDLSDEEAKYRVGKLGKQAFAALKDGGEHVYSGWKDVPCWFLATVEDRGLPIEMQRMLVGMARSEGADIVLREVQSSHSPFFSRSEETVEFLVDAVTAFAK
ncbi:hypothetical protein HYALB_00008137 [Hymenoscyphus albidus]|uniref:AB hydrolase-1 domain-containing protein n=1 Tax=Hymenoscyphus albidus TaxID=595503 RepID=A0A9N9LGA0_9HELO|nr:hypothetical protein HYALB_00008137 [Hymenoscyphus albidus]